MDGIIYDREGYTIAEMWVAEGAPGAPRRVKGNSEVCIVPDPGNCFRYYIFSTSANTFTPIGAYTILDMELPNTYPGNEDRLGALVFGEWNQVDNCKPILSLGLPDGIGGTMLYGQYQDAFFAATDVNENNECFVFVQIEDGVWKLVIDENGISASPDDPISLSEIFPGYQANDWVSLRHVLEVVRLANGNYRLGLTHPVSSAF